MAKKKSTLQVSISETRNNIRFAKRMRWLGASLGEIATALGVDINTVRDYLQK